jgi:Protein of unknown function with PCYCGC motif
MKKFATLMTTGVLLVVSGALLALPQFAQTQQPAPAAEPVPAFHAEPPAGELPQTLEPSLYTDKLVFNAYAVAARTKKVLYQEPCYCHCDRSQGHTSLLNCFATSHGSGCETCIKEVFYSYEQTRRGKTPAQIREGIIRGDWQKVQLAKYQQNYLPPVAVPTK